MSQLPPSARCAPAAEKLQQVQRLVDVLSSDLGDHALLPAQRAACLEQLKVFGRDTDGSDPIFTEEGIKVLCMHGFDGTDETSAREALRCLANALLVVSRTRQIIVDLGYAQKAAAAYVSEEVDDEFLLARILFLITYETTVDLGLLLQDQQLDEHLNSAVKRHADFYRDGGPAQEPTPMQEMALAETLKLLFNMTHFLNDRSSAFSTSIPHLFKILRLRSLATPPLQPPTSLIINALLNLDLDSEASLTFSSPQPSINMAQLLKILDYSLDKKFTRLTGDPAKHFDEVGAPLITLLRKLYEIAPAEVKTLMQTRLLPSDEDRNQPLGQGHSLSSRMLQISTSASAPKTRDNVMHLLFELSSSNAETFVHNIGYGYASGFLMTKKIPFTSQAASAGSSSAGAINPVTGQRLDREPAQEDPFEGMSEADKEREAERLFVLFERHALSISRSSSSVSRALRRLKPRGLLRLAWTNTKKRSRLKRTGIVDVQNPVELAKEEGRFEELPDDHEER